MRPRTATAALTILLLAALTAPACADGPSEAGPTTQPADRLAATPQACAPAANADALKVYAAGDYAGAIRLLEPAYKAKTASIQQRIVLARAYAHTGRADAALACLRSVLAADSENPEANNLVGQLLHAAGKHAEAVKFLEHGYKLKKDAYTAGLLGQSYYALGQLAKAREYLQAALAEDVRNPANSLILGRLFLDRGSGALAEKYLLMAQDAGLETIELHHLLGKAYLLQRKYVGPVMAKRLPGEHKPEDIVDECVVLRKFNDRPDQWLVCTRFCALHEGRWLLRKIGERKEGWAEVEVPLPPPEGNANGEDRQLIWDKPGTIKVLSPETTRLICDADFMIVTGWFSVGQYDLARQYLTDLADREHASQRVLDLQARLQIATADFAGLNKTLSAATKAKAFDATTVADFYYQAAVALRADGKAAEALAMLAKADKLAPTSAKVLRALARLSESVGRSADAAGYYARLVELFPDAADIDELRNRLRTLRERSGLPTSQPDEDDEADVQRRGTEGQRD